MSELEDGMAIARWCIAEEAQQRSGYLDLGMLGLTGLPEELFALRHLQALNLGLLGMDAQGQQHIAVSLIADNALPAADLARLGELLALRALSLFGMEALDDLMPLAGLSALQGLDCSGPPVSDLTPLAGLSALQTLNCSETPISDLTPLAGLSDLQELNCSGTSVSDLTPLASLSALQKLYCRNTPVSDLTPLADLPALQTLDCSGCRLERVPAGFWHKPSLKELMLWETQLPGIPAEVLSQDLGDNCLPRLRAHLDDLAAGSAALRDVKLLVLGNGRVGKTQLCRRLRGEVYDPALPSTHGIVVSSAPLPGEAEAQLKLWDFGGQDIYHGTHALFMRHRALFLLVWAPECEENREHEYGGMHFRNHPLAYWLDYVRHLAGSDSPLLIVQTRCDRAEDEARFPPLDPAALQGFAYCKILHYSALNERGRAALDEALADAAAWLHERRGTARIGAGRLRVQRRLEALRDADAAREPAQRQYRTLSQEHYRQLCREAGGVSAPEYLLDYLHQAGIVFYRQGLFDERIILDQAWALEAVYALFHREKCYRQLRQLHGRFTRPLLELLVWQDYSADEQRLFLDMMRSCGVCFIHRKGHGWGPENDDTEYLAPELLPERAAVAEALREKWDETAPCVQLQRHYPLLHAGLLRGLLARIGEQAGINALYWRDGVCLYEHGSRSRALIEQHMEEGWRGHLRLAAQGGQAQVLLDRLLELLNQEEQRWGMKGSTTMEGEWSVRATSSLIAVAEVARLTKHAEPPPLQLTQEPSARPEYCVSYAWGDAANSEREAVVERLCLEAAQRGIAIVRDKDALGLGDSISRFMARIGRADRVFVILSDKYLKSPYCMFELWEVWRYSRQEPEAFALRVRLYRLPCAEIATPLQRAQHAVYWKQQHDELAALIREHGADILGEADFKQFKLMQDFAHRVSDILAAMADTVQARDFAELIDHGLDV